MANKTLPYETATTGSKAIEEMRTILEKFGCQSFGYMTDYAEQALIVQFEHRNRRVSIKASKRGYAAAWLRNNPVGNVKNQHTTKEAREKKALEIANVAVYSILRDWVKAQVALIECEILSFEGAFLGQIMLPSGQSMLQMVESKQLLLESKNV